MKHSASTGLQADLLKVQAFFFSTVTCRKKSSVTATQALRSEIPAAPQGFFMRNKKNCSDCSSCLKKKKAALLICDLDWKYVHLKKTNIDISPKLIISVVIV